MSSELIVKVQRIHAIKKHPQADRLEIAVIGAEGGWETCVKVGVFQPGDLVVYIPPDALLPRVLHEQLGITNYCGELPAASEDAVAGFRRVKAARLRGTKSFGTLMTVDDLLNYVSNNVQEGCPITVSLVEGFDVVDILGIKKWTPKEKVLCGEAAREVTWFHKYTDIQNIKNYPGLFKQGEQVVMTEKIHGTNCRVGLAADPELENTMQDAQGNALPPTLSWMAGSHTVQRKQYDAEGRKSKYWEPLDIPEMRDMIIELANTAPGCFSVVVFGEIYGAGIQDMNYGLVGKTGFRVFDIAINGKYMDWDDVVCACQHKNIETVPELYRGPFSNEMVEQFTDGPTTLTTPDKITCKYKGREGGVIKTLVERYEPELSKGGNRMILKSVSADYLDRKGAVDNA